MKPNPLPGVPLVESPFFESLVDSLPAETAAIARKLHTDGYAVIDFPDPDFHDIARTLVADLTPHYDIAGWREKKKRGEGKGLRIQDAVNLHKYVLRIACNEKLIDLLSTLYGRRAFPFQTLNFPVGTEQHYHTDSLHFSSVPERFMCGVWVALEDVGAEQGPLVYYPGSHRFPVYANEHYGNFAESAKQRTQQQYEPAWERLVQAHGLKPQVFLPKRGQALIWAANLLHGGLPHNDPERTRWSQVTHYYFEDCTYFAPIHSDVLLGRMAIKNIVDLTTGKKVENRYLGQPLPAGGGASGRPAAPAVLPDDFVPARYLELNPDVRAAGADAATHFLKHGIRERRRYK